MGKSVHDDVLDALLSYIAAHGDKVVICSAEPATFAEAQTIYALADYAPSFSGPLDGDVSGRKLTVDAASGIEVDTSGTGNHVAVLDTVASKLLYVTTISIPRALAAGATCQLEAWHIEIADPV